MDKTHHIKFNHWNKKVYLKTTTENNVNKDNGNKKKKQTEIQIIIKKERNDCFNLL